MQCRARGNKLPAVVRLKVERLLVGSDCLMKGGVVE